jgi:hypothetical protein
LASSRDDFIFNLAWLMAYGSSGRHVQAYMGIARAEIKARTARQDMEMLLFTTNRQSAEPAECRVIRWYDRVKTAAAPVSAAVWSGLCVFLT